MDNSNSKNFSLLVMLVVLLIGVFGYCVFTSFTDQSITTDLSSLVSN